MQQIFTFLGAAVSIYSLVITVRIILTWFRGTVRVPDALARVTDPYLNLFRKLRFLRIGSIDLSPIAALASLTIAGGIFGMIARFGAVRLGVIAAMIVQVIGSALLFFVGFFVLVLVLRLIAYLTNQNTYSVFWRAIDTISRPVLYRISRILFGGRIINFRNSILISIAIFVVLYGVLHVAFSLLTGFLGGLPV